MIALGAAGDEDIAPGTLYVVATPIGNLEDVSARALRVLGEVDLIAAEDTRVTRKLLSRYDIHRPLVSFHSQSGPARRDALLSALSTGRSVALVTDSGTPGISDPGGELVRACLELGVEVTPIPGPSAVTTALSACGLDPSRFVFLGFLPRKAGNSDRLLEQVRGLPFTLVLYEAPSRVAATLLSCRAVLGDRPAVVARELTKRFEEFARGALSVLADRFRAAEPRGECVILIRGAEDSVLEPDAERVDRRLGELMSAGVTARDAARKLSEELGLPRKEAYAACLRWQSGADREDSGGH